MKDLLKLEIVFSESHKIVPKIILIVLIILGAWIIITSYLENKKRGTKKEKFKFFIDGYDKVKFFGTIGLLVAYVIALEYIGFLVSSIVFIFVTTMFFYGTNDKKTVIVSGISAITTSVLVWYLFGTVFNITLP